jgi:hypothetical protein
MIHFNNVHIELIENFPCDTANDLIYIYIMKIIHEDADNVFLQN